MATTRRSLNNTLGEPIAPTVYPYGPQWEGKVAPYTPSFNTPHHPGVAPPPMGTGTLRRSTLFPTQPPPAPSEPFGDAITVKFELRSQATRHQKSDAVVSVQVGNHTPLGRIIDKAVTSAYHSGKLDGFTDRILAVFGPSGKQLNVGSGYTLYDQSPPVPPGSTIVLVFKN
eukprot:CAMPEP_0202893084 /NCGR_PEP_ID=MMETSP1392-20130828/2724_1 /ASSEMBLY_ACC=CAM_ASM_000868 /TAXON_ID=225041 /ORGANISM="Chlamydomonas chlamydogama, Strain SAG 11-48b" /LENGTH=170 /DNA_ID=CAMNT_0049577279 /DNA_START=25 /DNA_END=537 /DNA_ORIENTATION=-